jgi:hypothetical protein
MPVPSRRAFTLSFGEWWDELIVPKLSASRQFFPLDLSYIPLEESQARQAEAQRKGLPPIATVSYLDIFRAWTEEKIKSKRNYPVKYIMFVAPDTDVRKTIHLSMGKETVEQFRRNGQLTRYVLTFRGESKNTIEYDIEVLKYWADRVLQNRLPGQSAYEVLVALHGYLQKYAPEVVLFDVNRARLAHLRTADWLELMDLPLSEGFKAAVMARPRGWDEVRIETVKINKVPLKLGNEVSDRVVQAWNTGTLDEVLQALTRETRRVGGKGLPRVQPKDVVWLGFGDQKPIAVRVGRLVEYLRQNNKGLEALTSEDATRLA